MSLRGPRVARSRASRELGCPGRADVASAVDRGHVRIAVAGSRAFREGLLDARELVLRQPDSDCGDVLPEIAAPLRAGDRDDVLAAAQHPGDRELCRRDALLLRDLAYPVEQVVVVREVVALEARAEAAEVGLLEIVQRANLPGEEAASERAV